MLNYIRKSKSATLQIMVKLEAILNLVKVY